MEQSSDGEPADMLAHVLVPVATPNDARETADALAPYALSSVTVLHVVEKGDGAPDKTPVEQSEELAADAFAAFREQFPDAETHTTYGRNIAAKIFEVAETVDASAVAYRSRGGGRLAHFLSGDLSLKLATNADRPVIALPRVDD